MRDRRVAGGLPAAEQQGQGAVFLLVGVAGFILGITTDYDALTDDWLAG